MGKTFSKALAALVAVVLLFTNTNCFAYAANSSSNFANVVISENAKEQEQIDSNTISSNESDVNSNSDITSIESQLTTPDSKESLEPTDQSTDSSYIKTPTSDSTKEEQPDDITLDPSATDLQTQLPDTTDKLNGDITLMPNNTESNSTATASVRNEATDYEWKSIAFGQSTDLNFRSNILPKKIGIQYAKETQIKVQGALETVTKDAIVVESRGGKIANAHDGLSYYYTTLPTSKNFVLEAKVFINQFGPEDGSTPSKQEGAGIMARDILGAARQDPMIPGFEELPAASNTAVTMIMADKKDHNSVLNLVSYQRNGVFYPYGNAHVSYGSTKFAKTNENGSRKVTQDITPEDGIYQSNDFFTLRLERTNEGFITTYIDANGNSKSGSIDDAARLSVIDKDNMSIGFFSSRNAKVTFTDIFLMTSEANTTPSTFVPDSYDLTFLNLSNTTTSSSDYMVAFRTNFDGSVEIKQGDSVIEANGTVTAGEIYELPTILTSDLTDFTINYSSDHGTKTESFRVTRNEAYQKDLYVATNGTSNASGDIDSPLDLNTAINYISKGHTIFVREGTYDALDLATTHSGSSTGQKTLTSYNNETVIFSGNSYVKASYWNIKGISITGSNSAGIRVTGNSNTFESCKFYQNEDTGFQLGMGSDTDPLTWPENNTIRYCSSFENVDVSGINADGFAAKLGVGKGNLFDSCVSYNNRDDGWDLFNKLGDAKNEPVTIQNCIAYGNGNNGFKLGGEGYAVNHVITGCLAFKNNLDGFTDNFNTGVLTVSNCTSVDNERYNYIFRFNPYATEDSEQSLFVNNISFRSNYDDTTVNDYIAGNIQNCYLFEGENNTITTNDFVSVTAPSSYERNADQTIQYGDYMRPVPNSFLANSGTGSTSYLGAIAPTKTDTVVEPDILITSITLDSTLATLKLGETLSLKPVIAPENATSQTLNWTSSAPTVVAVDETGMLQALAEGTATITVSSTDGSNVTTTCDVKVQPDILSVTFLMLDKGSISLPKGDSEVLSVTVTPKNATNPAVTWTSFNSNIATVDEAGKVTAKDYGIANIVVTSNDNPNIRNTCVVSVGYTIRYYLNKGTNHLDNPSAYYKEKISLASPTRKGYEFKGWYTDKNFKTKITTIKKSSSKNYKLYAKWEKVKKPTAPTIKSIENIKSQKMKVTLESSIKEAKGYEIVYATNKKFTKNKDTTQITNHSTLTKNISKLKKGKSYYVKVRSYRVDSTNSKIYSGYSKVLKVKIK